MPVSNVLKFVKSTRITLVIFFIYDVDLGLFIFIILHPYKTPFFPYSCYSSFSDILLSQKSSPIVFGFLRENMRVTVFVP